MMSNDVTLNKQHAEIFVPDGTPVPEALERTTHMAVAAHCDDLEIMAYDGILKCFHKEDQWFLGVVATDGAGSPRDKFYADYTDEEMVLARSLEQKKAAMLGEYAAAALLSYSSGEVKDAGETGPVNDLIELLQRAKPVVLYTHTLTDRHDTHVAVALRTIKAIRSLPAENRPQKVFGCEVWRDLDWLLDEDKIVFDVSAHPNLASALLGVFDTQNSGAKRIDQATLGRRICNATYHASHDADEASALIYATDLTRLIDESDFHTEDHVKDLLDHFSNDVMERLKRVG